MVDEPKRGGDEAAPEEDAGGAAAGIARRRHPRARLSILVQYRFDTFDDFLG